MGWIILEVVFGKNDKRSLMLVVMLHFLVLISFVVVLGCFRHRDGKQAMA